MSCFCTLYFVEGLFFAAFSFCIIPDEFQLHLLHRKLSCCWPRDRPSPVSCYWNVALSLFLIDPVVHASILMWYVFTFNSLTLFHHIFFQQVLYFIVNFMVYNSSRFSCFYLGEFVFGFVAFNPGYKSIIMSINVWIIGSINQSIDHWIIRSTSQSIIISTYNWIIEP